MINGNLEVVSGGLGRRLYSGLRKQWAPARHRHAHVLKDLRLKVLSAIDRGMPRKEVVEVLDVSLATIKRWLKRPEDATGWFIHCGYEAEA